MNYEVLEALGQIAREKNVEKELVVETLRAGIVSAARRRYGLNADIRVEFDGQTAGMKVTYVRQVVDDLTDPELEIEFDDARLIDPEIRTGGELSVELAFEEFGRNAIQAAKQVVVQRVREAERMKVFDTYHGRVGEIVTGSVQQVSRGNVIVNLGRAEAMLPFREQIRREQYRQGDTVRAIIVEVLRETKGPQIILSRASGEFLAKLFEMEVPEIVEGIVQIKGVAREAGGRTKIAVASTEFRVDPVGACVGMKGSRVQGIVRELSGERIDIVPFSEDPIAFVTKALSPAKILHVLPEEETKTMRVIVTEDQLSLAIGKGGQNVRLAARLTGWEVDLVPDETSADSAAAEVGVPVGEIQGIGPKTLESLVEAGLDTVQAVVRSSLEDLVNVPGVGDVTAQKIYLAAVQHMEEVEAEKAREEAARVDREAAEAKEAADAVASLAAGPVEAEEDPPAEKEEEVFVDPSIQAEEQASLEAARLAEEEEMAALDAAMGSGGESVDTDEAEEPTEEPAAEDSGKTEGE
ncbi:MAG: transcription termination factor NusA [Gemmatimonadota bacterium]|jgi:N utilization substance protein A|nr:transcription termination factor NusA [Gemmatimonadota bacterium]MDP6802266.1 transcription termination factor NusA [Gemmatimonadota bacterium]MDP7031539.1 transcription termination factor NusA [Gemmatimonadota bacterium]